MNQRNFLNLGLAIALAVLVAIVVYEPGKKIPEKTVQLTQLSPTNIQKIVIEQSKLPNIILSKINDQWLMIKPYDNRANTLRIDKLLALSNAKSHSRYSSSNINLKQLNLLAPDLIISLNETKFSFGTTDALEGFRYIQLKNTVHLITDRYSHLVKGHANKLLSPALLPENMIITKLVLPEITLQKNEMGWETNPRNNTIGADQRQQLLDEWRFARALRVSKITTIDKNTFTGSNSAVIKVSDNKNRFFSFKLMRSEDEIILINENTSLAYHFDIEAGERLLNPPATTPKTAASN